MGRVKGKPHSKPRKYLSASDKEALVRRYLSAVAAGEFLTQAQLGTEFGVTQVAASNVLRAANVKTRTREEAWPTKVNPQEAARLYLENPRMTLEEVGEHYDVGYAAVRDQLRKLGIPFRASKDYPKYTTCDRSFFSVVDPVRAYFAGFIAADGYITKTGRSVNFGIHPKDVEIFHNLRAAASLDQPIVVRPTHDGKIYSWLTICSTEWVRDLERHYNIVNAKSLTLKPPNLTDERLIWHFIRGYFDGDGHAEATGKAINFVTGSPSMFDWLTSICGVPGHVQTTWWETDSKESYVSATGFWYSKKDQVRTIVPELYRDSTPETRLSRKYERLKRHLGIIAEL
jgi:hypothetical protein